MSAGRTGCFAARSARKAIIKLRQIGWFVFGVGMILFWAFAGNADLSFVTSDIYVSMAATTETLKAAFGRW